MSYLYLILEALLPVAFAVGFKFLNYKTKFKKLPYWAKQTIYAIVFGGLAIFGTECGVSINGLVINVRDAPPIIAGLFFGAPAGVAAGLIGGLERLITGYFIVGRASTRIACSVATILAGILAAVLRKTTRKGKKVQVVTACTLAFMIEVFHMLLVYLTNTDDLEFVIGVYRIVVGPMIVANVLSVFLATWSDLLIDRHFAKEKLFRKIGDTQLSGAIQQATLVVALLTFAVGFVSINVIQTRISKENIENTLSSTSESVSGNVTSLVNYALGDYASELATLYNTWGPGGSGEGEKYQFYEIFTWLRWESVQEKDKYEGCFDGYIVEKNDQGKMVVKEAVQNSQWEKDDILDEDDLFKALKEKIDNPTITMYFNVLSEMRPTLLNGSERPVLYSIARYNRLEDNGKYIILSMDATQINQCVARNKRYILYKYSQAYETGITVLFDKDKKFIASTDDLLSAEQAADLLKLETFNILGQINFNNNNWYSVAVNGNIVYVYSIVTVDKAELPARVSMYSTSFLFTVTVGLIFLVANALIDRMIVRKMEHVGYALDRISGDKLNTKVNVHGFEEFNKLSAGINHTVDRLKGYMEEEKKRINKDLEFAKSIQKGTLPWHFPTNASYDLHADMKPAKQVGGDFYDFFPLPNNRLFFLMADVSGKGVPAAMFMMRSEALIKSLVQADELTLDKIMVTVNNDLCTNNDAQMFVTCWCGILDLTTGHIDFVNAGHNAPIVKRKRGEFEEVPVAKNFVLAGMENIPFRSESIDLKPGDEIFIYTDGVTEATSKAQQLYGIKRLLSFMNRHKYHNSKEMIQGIMKQLDNFQKGVDQADDITMLMIRYKPKKN